MPSRAQQAAQHTPLCGRSGTPEGRTMKLPTNLALALTTSLCALGRVI